MLKIPQQQQQHQHHTRTNAREAERQRDRERENARCPRAIVPPVWTPRVTRLAASHMAVRDGGGALGADTVGRGRGFLGGKRATEAASCSRDHCALTMRGGKMNLLSKLQLHGAAVTVAMRCQRGLLFHQPTTGTTTTMATMTTETFGPRPEGLLSV